MGALSVFKAMKFEDFSQDVAVFRTSRVCRVLGGLFLFAGLSIIFKILFGKIMLNFYFCTFSLIVAGIFLMAGLVLVTYRKTVTMNSFEKKVMMEETSILGIRSTAFHFDEIMSVEVARDSECFLSNHATMWVVKAYLQHDDFTVEKIFATISPTEAKSAAQALAFAAGKDLVISCRPEERLIFGRI